ncbi:MAG: hypothetical protein PHR61_01350 [Candidatus Absconditabacteria bacterium]|nr:hypothetical protein [Candidatus Absconditabacteria bacterium]
MKVVFPKNIQKGMLAGMTFSIGPINLSIIQLFVVGIGVAVATAIFNSFSKSGAKAIGALLAIFAFLLFVFIAFFKMSELGLIPFVAKLVRNLFFDTPRKFQANYDKIDPLKVAIKRTKSSDQTQTIFEQKDKSYSKDKLDKINDSSLI